jgi:hypothetical protein
MVTATLLKLLGDGLADLVGNPDDDVTARPPDKARGLKTGPQVNLFLYHAGINAALRNQPPRQAREGEAARPSLPLDLFYLVTAYGSNDDDREAHALLGRALRILYDNPLLAALPEQPEGVRLTFQPFTSEEQYKLWSTFQTSYRISAAFQVSLVLIDSELSSPAALPVLRRGSDDRGPAAIASGLPILASAAPDVLPAAPSAQLGDVLRLKGQNIAGSGVAVRFTTSRLPDFVSLTPLAGGGSGEIAVKLPDDAAAASAWAPGFYTVQLMVTQGTLPRVPSNEVPLTLAPVITLSANTVSTGDTLTISVTPHLQALQRVQVIFGSLPLPSPAIAAETDSIDIEVPAVPAGTYLVRLRVDGVDSLSVRRTGSPPRFEFNPDLQVKVV